MMYEIISNKFVNHPAVQELLRIDIRSLVIDNIEQIITLLKTQGILKYMACFKHDMDNNEQYEKIQYVILFSTSYFNRELIRHGVIFPTKGGTAFKFLLSYFNFNEIQENKIKSIVGYIGKCMYGTNDIDYSLWCDPRIYGSFSPEDLIEFRNCMCNMLAYKLYEIINYNYILDEVMYQSPKPENTGGGGGSAVSLSKPDIQESFVYKLALNYYGSPVVLTDINPVETDNNTIQYIQIPITILINGGVYYGHIYIDYYDIFRQDKEKYADKYKPESFFGRKFNNYIKYFNAIDSVLGKKK